MPIEMQIEEDGESKSHSVMGWIGIAPTRKYHPTRKRADFRLVFHDEKEWQMTQKEKQMVAETISTELSEEETVASASFHDMLEWHGIQWYRTERNVRRLQARIVKATQEKRWGKVKALQRLLTHSFSGKALAVRRVTENRSA